MQVLPKMGKCPFCSCGSVRPGDGKCYDEKTQGRVSSDAWTVDMETFSKRDT